MAASIKDFIDELSEEAEAILASDFKINVTETRFVPDSEDSALTFPNLDTGEMNCKIIETCVLYVDMRRSTELSLAHRRETVARLYSVFVRAMVRCAEYHGGKVRGIIGDRVMVIFDSDGCFVKAVNAAILMNTAMHTTINPNFAANEVSAGIGIDYGRMLVTKAGVRKHGVDNASYKSLVWLGKPANVASKLTDIARKKPTEKRLYVSEMHRADPPPPLPSVGLAGLLAQTSPLSINPLTGGLFDIPLANLLSGAGKSPPPKWVEIPAKDFLGKLRPEYTKPILHHSDPSFQAFTTHEETQEGTERPGILMTEKVYAGLVKAEPARDSVKQGLFKKLTVRIAGDSRTVYGGNVVFTSV